MTSESESEGEEACMKQYRKNIGVLENSRDSVGPKKRGSGLAIWQNLSFSLTPITSLDYVIDWQLHSCNFFLLL